MRSTLKTYGWAGALLTFTALAHAQPRPTVVELFTSQGCSSCPPAERYVGELVQRPNVLALTYHVDYWNDLGWRDRFSLPEATQRQRGYAKSLRLRTVYTPQVVIDGNAEYVGSDRASIDAALSPSRSGAAIKLSVNNQELMVDLAEQAGVAPSDILLVSYLREAVSPIGRGENAGLTIKESNIVRAVRNVGHWEGRTQQYRVRLDSLPREATHVAVLVQSPGQAPIIGAASIALR